MGRPDEPLRIAGKSRVRKRRSTHQDELWSHKGRETRGANGAKTQARDIRERVHSEPGIKPGNTGAGDQVGRWFYKGE